METTSSSFSDASETVVFEAPQPTRAQRRLMYVSRGFAQLVTSVLILSFFLDPAAIFFDYALTVQKAYAQAAPTAPIANCEGPDPDACIDQQTTRDDTGAPVTKDVGEYTREKLKKAAEKAATEKKQCEAAKAAKSSNQNIECAQAEQAEKDLKDRRTHDGSETTCDSKGNCTTCIKDQCTKPTLPVSNGSGVSQPTSMPGMPLTLPPGVSVSDPSALDGALKGAFQDQPTSPTSDPQQNKSIFDRLQDWFSPSPETPANFDNPTFNAANPAFNDTGTLQPGISTGEANSTAFPNGIPGSAENTFGNPVAATDQPSSSQTFFGQIREWAAQGYESMQNFAENAAVALEEWTAPISDFDFAQIGGPGELGPNCTPGSAYCSNVPTQEQLANIEHFSELAKGLEAQVQETSKEFQDALKKNGLLNADGSINQKAVNALPAATRNEILALQEAAQQSYTDFKEVLDSDFARASVVEDFAKGSPQDKILSGDTSPETFAELAARDPALAEAFGPKPGQTPAEIADNQERLREYLAQEKANYNQALADSGSRSICGMDGSCVTNVPPENAAEVNRQLQNYNQLTQDAQIVQKANVEGFMQAQVAQIKANSTALNDLYNPEDPNYWAKASVNALTQGGTSNESAEARAQRLQDTLRGIAPESALGKILANNKDLASLTSNRDALALMTVQAQDRLAGALAQLNAAGNGNNVYFNDAQNKVQVLPTAPADAVAKFNQELTSATNELGQIAAVQSENQAALQRAVAAQQAQQQTLATAQQAGAQVQYDAFGHFYDSPQKARLSEASQLKSASDAVALFDSRSKLEQLRQGGLNPATFGLESALENRAAMLENSIRISQGVSALMKAEPGSELYRASGSASEFLSRPLESLTPEEKVQRQQLLTALGERTRVEQAQELRNSQFINGRETLAGRVWGALVDTGSGMAVFNARQDIVLAELANRIERLSGAAPLTQADISAINGVLGKDVGLVQGAINATYDFFQQNSERLSLSNSLSRMLESSSLPPALAGAAVPLEALSSFGAGFAASRINNLALIGDALGIPGIDPVPRTAETLLNTSAFERTNIYALAVGETALDALMIRGAFPATPQGTALSTEGLSASGGFTFRPAFVDGLSGAEARIAKAYTDDLRGAFTDTQAANLTRAEFEAQSYQALEQNIARSNVAGTVQGENVLNALRAEMQAKGIVPLQDVGAASTRASAFDTTLSNFERQAATNLQEAQANVVAAQRAGVDISAASNQVVEAQMAQSAAARMRAGIAPTAEELAIPAVQKTLAQDLGYGPEQLQGALAEQRAYNANATANATNQTAQMNAVNSALAAASPQFANTIAPGSLRVADSAAASQALQAQIRAGAVANPSFAASEFVARAVPGMTAGVPRVAQIDGGIALGIDGKNLVAGTSEGKTLTGALGASMAVVASGGTKSVMILGESAEAAAKALDSRPFGPGTLTNREIIQGLTGNEPVLLAGKNGLVQAALDGKPGAMDALDRAVKPGRVYAADPEIGFAALRAIETGDKRLEGILKRIDEGIADEMHLLVNEKTALISASDKAITAGQLAATNVRSMLNTLGARSVDTKFNKIAFNNLDRVEMTVGEASSPALVNNFLTSGSRPAILVLKETGEVLGFNIAGRDALRAVKATDTQLEGMKSLLQAIENRRGAPNSYNVVYKDGAAPSIHPTTDRGITQDRRIIQNVYSNLGVALKEGLIPVTKVLEGTELTKIELETVKMSRSTNAQLASDVLQSVNPNFKLRGMTATPPNSKLAQALGFAPETRTVSATEFRAENVTMLARDAALQRADRLVDKRLARPDAEVASGLAEAQTNILIGSTKIDTLEALAEKYGTLQKEGHIDNFIYLGTDDVFLNGVGGQNFDALMANTALLGDKGTVVLVNASGYTGRNPQMNGVALMMEPKAADLMAQGLDRIGRVNAKTGERFLVVDRMVVVDRNSLADQVAVLQQREFQGGIRNAFVEQEGLAGRGTELFQRLARGEALSVPEQTELVARYQQVVDNTRSAHQSAGMIGERNLIIDPLRRLIINEPNAVRREELLTILSDYTSTPLPTGDGLAKVYGLAEEGNVLAARLQQTLSERSTEAVRRVNELFGSSGGNLAQQKILSEWQTNVVQVSGANIASIKARTGSAAGRNGTETLEIIQGLAQNSAPLPGVGGVRQIAGTVAQAASTAAEAVVSAAQGVAASLNPNIVSAIAEVISNPAASVGIGVRNAQLVAGSISDIVLEAGAIVTAALQDPQGAMQDLVNAAENSVVNPQKLVDALSVAFSVNSPVGAAQSLVTYAGHTLVPRLIDSSLESSGPIANNSQSQALSDTGDSSQVKPLSPPQSSVTNVASQTPPPVPSTVAQPQVPSVGSGQSPFEFSRGSANSGVGAVAQGETESLRDFVDRFRALNGMRPLIRTSLPITQNLSSPVAVRVQSSSAQLQSGNRLTSNPIDLSSGVAWFDAKISRDGVEETVRVAILPSANQSGQPSLQARFYFNGRMQSSDLSLSSQSSVLAVTNGVSNVLRERGVKVASVETANVSDPSRTYEASALSPIKRWTVTIGEKEYGMPFVSAPINSNGSVEEYREVLIGNTTVGMESGWLYALDISDIPNDARFLTELQRRIAAAASVRVVRVNPIAGSTNPFITNSGASSQLAQNEQPNVQSPTARRPSIDWVTTGAYGFARVISAGLYGFAFAMLGVPTSVAIVGGVAAGIISSTLNAFPSIPNSRPGKLATGGYAYVVDTMRTLRGGANWIYYNNDAGESTRSMTPWQELYLGVATRSLPAIASIPLALFVPYGEVAVIAATLGTFYGSVYPFLINTDNRFLAGRLALLNRRLQSLSEVSSNQAVDVSSDASDSSTVSPQDLLNTYQLLAMERFLENRGGLFLAEATAKLAEAENQLLNALNSGRLEGLANENARVAAEEIQMRTRLQAIRDVEQKGTPQVTQGVFGNVISFFGRMVTNTLDQLAANVVDLESETVNRTREPVLSTDTLLLSEPEAIALIETREVASVDRGFGALQEIGERGGRFSDPRAQEWWAAEKAWKVWADGVTAAINTRGAAQQRAEMLTARLDRLTEISQQANVSDEIASVKSDIAKALQEKVDAELALKSFDDESVLQDRRYNSARGLAGLPVRRFEEVPAVASRARWREAAEMMGGVALLGAGLLLASMIPGGDAVAGPLVDVVAQSASFGDFAAQIGQGIANAAPALSPILAAIPFIGSNISAYDQLRDDLYNRAAQLGALRLETEPDSKEAKEFDEKATELRDLATIAARRGAPLPEGRDTPEALLKMAKEIDSSFTTTANISISPNDVAQSNPVAQSFGILPGPIGRLFGITFAPEGFSGGSVSIGSPTTNINEVPALNSTSLLRVVTALPYVGGALSRITALSTSFLRSTPTATVAETQTTTVIALNTTGTSFEVLAAERPSSGRANIGDISKGFSENEALYVEWEGNTEALRREGVTVINAKNSDSADAIASPVTSRPMYTDCIDACLVLALTGIDRNTGEPLAALSHSKPSTMVSVGSSFDPQVAEQVKVAIQAQVSQMLDQAAPETISATLVGGLVTSLFGGRSEDDTQREIYDAAKTFVTEAVQQKIREAQQTDPSVPSISVSVPLNPITAAPSVDRDTSTGVYINTPAQQIVLIAHPETIAASLLEDTVNDQAPVAGTINPCATARASSMVAAVGLLAQANVEAPCVLAASSAGSVEAQIQMAEDQVALANLILSSDITAQERAQAQSALSALRGFIAQPSNTALAAEAANAFNSRDAQNVPLIRPEILIAALSATNVAIETPSNPISTEISADPIQRYTDIVLSVKSIDSIDDLRDLESQLNEEVKTLRKDVQYERERLGAPTPLTWSTYLNASPAADAVSLRIRQLGGTSRFSSRTSPVGNVIVETVLAVRRVFSSGRAAIDASLAVLQASASVAPTMAQIMNDPKLNRPGIELLQSDSPRAVSWNTVPGYASEIVRFAFDSIITPAVASAPIDSVPETSSGTPSDVLPVDPTILARISAVYPGAKVTSRSDGMFDVTLANGSAFVARTERSAQSIALSPNSNLTLGYLRSLNAPELKLFIDGTRGQAADRFVRGSVLAALVDITNAYAKKFDGEAIAFNSIGRSKEVQIQIYRNLGKTPYLASDHLTGKAIDLKTVGVSSDRISFIESQLKAKGFSWRNDNHGQGPHIHAALNRAATKSEIANLRVNAVTPSELVFYSPIDTELIYPVGERIALTKTANTSRVANVTSDQATIIVNTPLKANSDGNIDPVAFALRAEFKVANSSLKGVAPPSLGTFGVTTGSPREWARLFTMIQQQESRHRIAQVNKDGTLVRFPTTPATEKSFGPGQFNIGEYGLRSWADVNDPDKVIDAYIRVAQSDKLFDYFGSLQRPQETLQHAAWYRANVEPGIKKYIDQQLAFAKKTPEQLAAEKKVADEQKLAAESAKRAAETEQVAARVINEYRANIQTRSSQASTIEEIEALKAELDPSKQTAHLKAEGDKRGINLTGTQVALQISQLPPIVLTEAPPVAPPQTPVSAAPIAPLAETPPVTRSVSEPARPVLPKSSPTEVRIDEPSTQKAVVQETSVPIQPWAYLIGRSVTLTDVDALVAQGIKVVKVDPTTTSLEVMRALKERGISVLAYFNGAANQPGETNPWSSVVNKKLVFTYPLKGYPKEGHYPMDARGVAYQKERFAQYLGLMQSNGKLALVDAIGYDNIFGCFEDTTCRTASGLTPLRMADIVGEMAQVAHEYKVGLILKNPHSVANALGTGALAKMYGLLTSQDVVIAEQAAQYGEAGRYAALPPAVPLYAVEHSGTVADRRAAFENAKVPHASVTVVADGYKNVRQATAAYGRIARATPPAIPDAATVKIDHARLAANLEKLAAGAAQMVINRETGDMRRAQREIDPRLPPAERAIQIKEIRIAQIPRQFEMIDRVTKALRDASTPKTRTEIALQEELEKLQGEIAKLKAGRTTEIVGATSQEPQAGAAPAAPTPPPAPPTQARGVDDARVELAKANSAANDVAKKIAAQEKAVKKAADAVAAFSKLSEATRPLVSNLEQFFVRKQAVTSAQMLGSLNKMQKERAAFKKSFDTLLTGNKDFVSLNAVADELVNGRQNLARATGYDPDIVLANGGKEAEDAFKKAPGQIGAVRTSIERVVSSLNVQRQAAVETLAVLNGEQQAQRAVVAALEKEIAAASTVVAAAPQAGPQTPVSQDPSTEPPAPTPPAAPTEAPKDTPSGPIARAPSSPEDAGGALPAAPDDRPVAEESPIVEEESASAEVSVSFWESINSQAQALLTYAGFFALLSGLGFLGGRLLSNIANKLTSRNADNDFVFEEGEDVIPSLYPPLEEPAGPVAFDLRDATEFVRTAELPIGGAESYAHVLSRGVVEGEILAPVSPESVAAGEALVLMKLAETGAVTSAQEASVADLAASNPSLFAEVASNPAVGEALAEAARTHMPIPDVVPTEDGYDFVKYNASLSVGTGSGFFLGRMRYADMVKRRDLMRAENLLDTPIGVAAERWIADYKATARPLIVLGVGSSRRNASYFSAIELTKSEIQRHAASVLGTIAAKAETPVTETSTTEAPKTEVSTSDVPASEALTAAALDVQGGEVRDSAMALLYAQSHVSDLHTPLYKEMVRLSLMLRAAELESTALGQAVLAWLADYNSTFALARFFGLGAKERNARFAAVSEVTEIAQSQQQTPEALVKLTDREVLDAEVRAALSLPLQVVVPPPPSGDDGGRGWIVGGMLIIAGTLAASKDAVCSRTPAVCTLIGFDMLNNAALTNKEGEAGGSGGQILKLTSTNQQPGTSLLSTSENLDTTALSKIIPTGGSVLTSGGTTDPQASAQAEQERRRAAEEKAIQDARKAEAEAAEKMRALAARDQENQAEAAARARSAQEEKAIQEAQAAKAKADEKALEKARADLKELTAQLPAPPPVLPQAPATPGVVVQTPESEKATPTGGGVTQETPPQTPPQNPPGREGAAGGSTGSGGSSGAATKESTAKSGLGGAGGFGSLMGILPALLAGLAKYFASPTPSPSATDSASTKNDTGTSNKTTVSIVSSPREVEKGKTALLSWSSVDTKRCVLFGPGDTRRGEVKSDSSTTTPALDRSTEFGIVCESTTPGIVSSAKTVVKVKGDTEGAIPLNVPGVPASSWNTTGSASGAVGQTRGGNSAGQSVGVSTGAAGVPYTNAIPNNEPTGPECTTYQNMDSFTRCLCMQSAQNCQPWKSTW